MVAPEYRCRVHETLARSPEFKRAKTDNLSLEDMMSWPRRNKQKVKKGSLPEECHNAV